MQITVKLFATLREGRFSIQTMEFPAGTTISRVILSLNIPPDQVFIIFVNSRHAEPDCESRENDVVAFFPPIGGG